MTIRLDYETVRDTTIRLVQAKPDYVYRSDHAKCVYAEHTVDGGWVPSCLVGQVFAEMGMPVAVLATLDTDIVTVLDRLQTEEEIEMGDDHEAVELFLMTAQEVQDGDGRTWGDALKWALSRTGDEL